jgi:hypothetical protein
VNKNHKTISYSLGLLPLKTNKQKKTNNNINGLGMVVQPSIPATWEAEMGE